MNVGQLIKHLETMPKNATVVYSAMSEVIDMDKEQVTLEKNKYIKRGDYYITYREHQWDYDKDGKPEFVTVCVFPGN